MESTVINIENAVVSYREDIALRGVSLTVRSGEFVGIVGPNGAGKTTLLTIVNGLGKLLQGRVSVLGHSHPVWRKALPAHVLHGRNGELHLRQHRCVPDHGRADQRKPGIGTDQQERTRT